MVLLFNSLKIDYDLHKLLIFFSKPLSMMWSLQHFTVDIKDVST